jgi:succinate-semialdehyde dehydrogenase/glutarate-semialdehyde dehydrogenase
VVGVISPWNYPFFLAWNPVIHAIAAGCTVVVKPSEVTATVGEALAELFGNAGLPDGVVEVVHGGADVGAAIVEGVDMVSFTGSPATGRKVAAAAAERLVPAVLELGGKDAMVVLDDADVRRAARAAVWGSMVNAGQTCVAVERVYAVSSIHDRFLAEVLDLVDKLSAGSGDTTDIGPISHAPQVTVIQRHLTEASEAGARIVRGGDRHDAALGCAWIEPTVVVGVDHTMALMREETFGPVLAVMRVPNEAAALELANDSPFGLHGSVWSQDERRAIDFAKRMRTGSVAVNDVLANIYIPSLPFGGVGESGYGSNVGPEGLRAFCYQQTITSNRITLPREVWWYPRRFGSRGWKRIIRLMAGR